MRRAWLARTEKKTLERDLARQERVDAQQRICLLEGELRGEKDLKVAVEAVIARLTMRVS